MDPVPFSPVHNTRKFSAVWEQYLQTILKQFVQLTPCRCPHQRRLAGSWSWRAWLPGMCGTSSLQALGSRTRAPRARDQIKLYQAPISFSFFFFNIFY